MPRSRSPARRGSSSQRPSAADRPQPARLDQAARRRLPALRPQVRERDRAERGDARAARREHAGHGDGAQPAHRLRPRHRDRQGGRRLGSAASRWPASSASTNRCSTRRWTITGSHDRTTEPVGRPQIEAAAARIAGRVRETPVLDLEPRALGVDGALTLKLELLQHTGSFKPRGAFNAMLAADVPERRGRRVRRQLRARGCPRSRAAPPPRGDLRPRVLAGGEDRPPTPQRGRDRRHRRVLRRRARRRPRARQGEALELHAFDDPLVVAGQGTCA